MYGCNKRKAKLVDPDKLAEIFKPIDHHLNLCIRFGDKVCQSKLWSKLTVGNGDLSHDLNVVLANIF